ncbi:MAG: glycosyltransferase [Bacteroidales bacterium]|nr:glycosyltransferase [Bacteroidales bacterium]
MITVCIPTYCYDVRELVSELRRQAQQVDVEFEIVVIDDGSPKEWQQKYETISDMAKFIFLPQNVGRAAVRNLFLHHARNNWLLFLDSDVLPVDSLFLKQYVDTIKKNPSVEVICGGIQMPPKPDDRKQILRWYYGLKRESRSAEQRNRNRYQSFMTGNFCIRKTILQQIPFDERLVRYGHEDTLFGYRLMQHGISIKHIDNPVFHLQLEDADQFLKKTEIAVSNLYYISKTLLQLDYLFISQNKLLRKAYQFKRYGLSGFCGVLFSLFQPIISWLLTQRKPLLWLFDLYKLGYLCRIMR